MNLWQKEYKKTWELPIPQSKTPKFKVEHHSAVAGMFGLWLQDRLQDMDSNPAKTC